MNDTTRGARLEFLDTLRGMAALYVVIFHMVYVPNPRLAVPQWAEKVVGHGGTGVALFFVVSAFSLFYTMPMRLAKDKPLLNFYLHRFFRIAPLFYVVLLASLIRDHFLFHVTNSVTRLLTNAFFLFNFDPKDQEGIVWASWTIGVEMPFYAIFPLIYSGVRSLTGAVSLAIGCLILWLVLQVALLYSPLTPDQATSFVKLSVFRFLPIFACGIICFFSLQKHLHDALAPPKQDFGTVLLLSGVLLYVGFLNKWLPNIFGDNYYWEGLVYLTVTIGLCYHPTKLLVNRVTCHLGKISYSLYLLHPIIVYLLAPTYRTIYTSIPTTTLAFLSCIALTLSILVPLSELTYRLVEKPGMRLGNKIYEAVTRTH